MWFSVHPTYLLASALAVVRASLDFCSSDSRERIISRREEVRECSSSRSLHVWRARKEREREGGRGLGMRIRHVVLAAWYRVPDLIQLKL